MTVQEKARRILAWALTAWLAVLLAVALAARCTDPDRGDPAANPIGAPSPRR